MTKEAEVQIESMAFRGFGVTRIEGKVVFVPYTATGDRARIEVVEEKKNYSLGKVTRIIEPSPWRTDPPCPYFGVCGGCQWQHIRYPIHGEIKCQVLRDVLGRLGGLKEIPPVHVIPSSASYGYRVRVQMKVKDGRMGFFEERSHRVVDIEHCPIAHPLVNGILATLRDVWASLSPAEGIEINVSPDQGKGLLLLRVPSLPPTLRDLLKALLRAHPQVKGAAVLTKGKTLHFGDPFLSYRIPSDDRGEHRDLRLRTSPGSFIQVNLDQNTRLIQTVVEYAGVRPEERVLDLYAGVGNLTLPLALQTEEIYGVEENRDAVQDGMFSARENGLQACTFITGKAEDVLARWDKRKPHVVVLDPPRTGCRKVLDHVLRWKPRRILYVSCSPATFARDLRFLSERQYALEKLTLLDMFPQTYHMECVGLLRPPCSGDTR